MPFFVSFTIPPIFRCLQIILFLPTNVMKFVRILLKILLGLVVIILVFVAVSVAPVDDTPYQQMPYYAQTKAKLAALPPPKTPSAPLRAGWAKANITPPYTTPTGGYGARRGKHWTTVSDSIFARVIVLSNGSTNVAVIGLDLLITPPTVTEALKKRLPEVGLRWENVYAGAIHSHNSMGGWAPGLVGSLIAGEYDETIVPRITDGILNAIRAAQASMAPVQVGFGQTDATDHIYNRIGDSGPTRPLDGLIRLLKLKKGYG